MTLFSPVTCTTKAQRWFCCCCRCCCARFVLRLLFSLTKPLRGRMGADGNLWLLVVLFYVAFFLLPFVRAKVRIDDSDEQFAMSNDQKRERERERELHTHRHRHTQTHTLSPCLSVSLKTSKLKRHTRHLAQLLPVLLLLSIVSTYSPSLNQGLIRGWSQTHGHCMARQRMMERRQQAVQCGCPHMSQAVDATRDQSSQHSQC